MSSSLGGAGGCTTGGGVVVTGSGVADGVGVGVGVGVTTGGAGLTHVAVVWSDSAPDRAVIVSLPAEAAVEHSATTPPPPVVTESVAGCAPVTVKSTRIPAS